ncbi:MAG TPA: PEP-CTERM sorting domain-containing protein [Gammaproteobacteria bacterium]|nr:PEP-CTERM sorting domain-containing protein [Gammaproteobacteria bacterium]
MNRILKGISLRRFSALAGLAMLSVASIAAAGPVPPAPLTTGPIYMHFSGYEYSGATTSYADNTWGIGKVDSVLTGTVGTPNETINPGGSTLFSENPGGHLYFMFYGLTNNGTFTCGSNTCLNSADGHFDLYYNTNNLTLSSLTTGNRTAADAFTGITDQGTLLASFDFVPGVVSGDNTTTLSGTAPGSVISGSANQGSATSYLAVNTAAGGAWASALNSNFFLYNTNGDPLPGAADVYNNTTYYSDPNASTTGFNLTYNDPATAAFVPEPSSLLIFGAGLIVLGFMSRRRFC